MIFSQVEFRVVSMVRKDESQAFDGFFHFDAIGAGFHQLFQASEDERAFWRSKQ